MAATIPQTLVASDLSGEELIWIYQNGRRRLATPEQINALIRLTQGPKGDPGAQGAQGQEASRDRRALKVSKVHKALQAQG